MHMIKNYGPYLGRYLS